MRKCVFSVCVCVRYTHSYAYIYVYEIYTQPNSIHRPPFLPILNPPYPPPASPYRLKRVHRNDSYFFFSLATRACRLVDVYIYMYYLYMYSIYTLMCEWAIYTRMEQRTLTRWTRIRNAVFLKPLASVHWSKAVVVTSLFWHCPPGEGTLAFRSLINSIFHFVSFRFVLIFVPI